MRKKSAVQNLQHLLIPSIDKIKKFIIMHIFHIINQFLRTVLPFIFSEEIAKCIIP